MRDDMQRSDRLFLDAVFLLVLIAFTAAFVRLMRPFFLSLFLAVILANAFRRVFQRFYRRFNRRRPAAAATTIVIVLVVLIPLIVVGSLVTAELIGVAEQVRTNWDRIAIAEFFQVLPGHLESVPVLGSVITYLPEINLEDGARQLLKNSSDYLLRLSQRSLGNLAQAVFGFVIMLLLVFFFLADGKRIIQPVRNLLPIDEQDLDQITGEMFNTTSATLTSTILIGLMEGALTTVLFLVFGLPSPFLWGVITILFSMIPLVGTNIVLVPAGLITMFAGRPVAGILIILAGAGGVAVTQNILRPKLVGDRTGLHPALALLATIGGIAWLGLIGFLAGPVLASVFIVTWRQFGRRYEALLAGKNTRSQPGTPPDLSDTASGRDPAEKDK